MKQYQYKEYGGKREHKQDYRGKYKKKTETYSKKTKYPLKNYRKTIYST